MKPIVRFLHANNANTKKRRCDGQGKRKNGMDKPDEGGATGRAKRKNGRDEPDEERPTDSIAPDTQEEGQKHNKKEILFNRSNERTAHVHIKD